MVTNSSPGELEHRQVADLGFWHGADDVVAQRSVEVE
jgi:hypothetical protein